MTPDPFIAHFRERVIKDSAAHGGGNRCNQCSPLRGQFERIAPPVLRVVPAPDITGAFQIVHDRNEGRGFQHHEFADFADGVLRVLQNVQYAIVHRTDRCMVRFQVLRADSRRVYTLIVEKQKA